MCQFGCAIGILSRTGTPCEAMKDITTPILRLTIGFAPFGASDTTHGGRGTAETTGPYGVVAYGRVGHTRLGVIKYEAADGLPLSERAFFGCSNLMGRLSTMTLGPRVQ